MRSFIAILSVLTIVSTAHATDLSCKLEVGVDTPNETVTQVTITNLEGKEGQDPEQGGLSVDLPDQGTTVPFEKSPDGTVIGAAFSNECDNHYDIEFPANDFEAIVNGNSKSISGLLTYDSPDNVIITSKMNCTVK